jgi:Bacterial lectin/Secretion system C-terminal sorting domain
MRKLYATLLFSVFGYWASAQFQTLANPATTVLQTSAPGYTEFRLTTTTPIEQAGAVWKTAQYNLSSNFSFSASLNFGIYTETNPDLTKPKSLSGQPNSPYNYQTGADGIAFVMAPAPYLGVKGEEIGYGTTIHDPVDGTPGYTPNKSLAIEMDTWQNVWPGHDGWADHHDPDGNHIAMLSNGQATHGTAQELVAPLSLSGDLEDGQWHDVTISWNAGTRTLTLTSTSGFAFSISKTFTQAQLDAIFGVGVTNINVGFTAATGTAGNDHKVRWITPPPTNCGPGRTQTQGGWGAPANGNNPGAYRDAHFATAFPSGVTVGIVGGGTLYSATWTTAAAVETYLPAGGPSAKLTADYTNATTNQLKNNAVAQVLTLSLSVGFDAADPNYSPSGTALSAMIITSGPFAGWTVGAFLTEANKVLGNDPAATHSVADVQNTAGAINENYDDGTTDNGYLRCPNTQQTGRAAPRDQITNNGLMSTDVSVYPNPSRGQVQVNMGALRNAEVTVVDSRGVVVERKLAGSTQTLSLDLKKYGTGVYLVKVVSGSTVKTSKVLVEN